MPYSILTFQDLHNAITKGQKELHIKHNILCHHSIILEEGMTLKGIPLEDGSAPILLFHNMDGIGITENNFIQDINIRTSKNKKAIFKKVTLC